MSMLLLIHSWGGANETVVRHWPYYLNFGAGRVVGVSTEKGDCIWPKGVESFVCGDGEYMNGPNLPRRLMGTILWSLNQPEEWCACCEYDHLALQPNALEGITEIHTKDPTVFCHRTGGQTFDAKVDWFAHAPWIWNKSAARVLVPEMQKIIDEGHCAYGKAESSPDVFWAYACERAKVTVIHDFFTMHSRNCYDLPGSLEEACDAVAMGVQFCHGVKHPHELEAIQNALLPV